MGTQIPETDNSVVKRQNTSITSACKNAEKNVQNLIRYISFDTEYLSCIVYTTDRKSTFPIACSFF